MVMNNPSESATAHILHDLEYLKKRYDTSCMYLQGFLRRYVVDKKVGLDQRFHI